MQRLIISIGILLVIVGLTWPWIKKLNLGHLPGDIVIKKQDFSFYFPIMTCIVISIVLSLLFWFFRE